MRDHRARARHGLNRTQPPGQTAGKVLDPRISIDLNHLRRLAFQARQLSFLPRQPAQSILNGKHHSRLRGRGLNFEELRNYLPSDDVRSIDWKVTARTGMPHVRVFTEEKDRPSLIVVDQRMSMFFGSVHNMKSVTAAECGALAAHAIQEQGDRVGGIVFGDEQLAEIRPRRGKASLMQLLTAIADANSLLRADAPNVAPIALNQVLSSVSKIAPRNHLILIFSDFNVIDEQTYRLVSGISQHNDLILGLVSDPYSREIPPGLRIVMSDGELQAEINTGDKVTFQHLQNFARERLAKILEWQHKLGIPVLPLTSGEDTTEQLRRLLGFGQRKVIPGVSHG